MDHRTNFRRSKYKSPKLSNSLTFQLQLPRPLSDRDESIGEIRVDAPRGNGLGIVLLLPVMVYITAQESTEPGAISFDLRPGRMVYGTHENNAWINWKGDSTRTVSLGLGIESVHTVTDEAGIFQIRVGTLPWIHTCKG
ncbi:MAG: hypothetical protein ACRDLB_08635 [Actinomycetota bacterium]